MTNKTLEEVKKKIESILNRYYKETGKKINSPIRVYEVINNKYNYKFEIEISEITEGKL